MKLSGLGEFGLIGWIREQFAAIPTHGCEGIGDDCAVLPFNEHESLVVTTDLLVEDIHFLRTKTPPKDLGYKSLAVNLSDVAAMGATPIASFLSIALPQNCSAEWIETFMEGYRELSAQFGVPLLGGDTTSSKDRITISVTAMGKVTTSCIKRRGDAQVDDVIFVTGELGASAQGLQDLLAEKTDSSFISLHNCPKPFIKEGIWLSKKTSVHAMMDVSDGIASDLGHILRASGCGAEVSVDMIPTNTSVELAVTGGEDYCLLFTANATDALVLQQEYLKTFGTPLYPIGKISAGDQIIWKDHGNVIYPQWKGFTHF